MSFAPPTTPPAPPTTWSLDWRGSTYHESKMTGRHLSILALISGSESYNLVDLNPMSGHQQLMMAIAMFEVAARVDATELEDPDELQALVVGVMEEVAQAPAEEILGALRINH